MKVFQHSRFVSFFASWWKPFGTVEDAEDVAFLVVFSVVPTVDIVRVFLYGYSRGTCESLKVPSCGKLQFNYVAVQIVYSQISHTSVCIQLFM